MKQRLRLLSLGSVVFLFTFLSFFGESRFLFFESVYAQREFHMVEKKLVEKYKLAQKYYLNGKENFIKDDLIQVMFIKEMDFYTPISIRLGVKFIF